MAGWDVSRHPEWDMMYSAGLTAGEIARIVGAARTTVQQHMAMRERYEPGTLARHHEAKTQRVYPWASTAWMARLAETAAFVSRHGRFPYASGDTAETALAAWLRVQRQAHHRGDLAQEKVAALDDVGDWTVPAGQAAKDARWRDQLYDLQVWMATHGRAPRYVRHGSEAEHGLGVWLHSQTQNRAEKTLAPWRITALDTAFPSGWHSRE